LPIKRTAVPAVETRVRFVDDDGEKGRKSILDRLGPKDKAGRKSKSILERLGPK